MLITSDKAKLTRNGAESKVIEQISCISCSSSDAFTVYQQANGSFDATCFSCGHYSKDPYQNNHPNGADNTQHISPPVTGFQRSTGDTPKSLIECLEHPIRSLDDRKLSHATCQYFDVRVGLDTRDGSTPIYHLYPFYNEEGDLTGYKHRTVKTKQFQTVGTVKGHQLFGLNKIRSKGKKLWITEGELDAMSLYQVLKEGSNVEWEPAVISIPMGTKSAVRALTENYDIISGYEEFILVFDNDAAGKECTKEICKILAGKVYTTKLSEKDPNDMLKAGKSIELRQACLFNQRKYQPDGIIHLKDYYETYKAKKEIVYWPFPETMPVLNEKMYGLKKGTICTITAATSAGKTQILREMKYHYLMNTDLKMADISLEEGSEETIKGLIALHVNKRINLPDQDITDEEEKNAYDALFASGKHDLYDFFGGMDDDNLFSKLGYFAANGANIIWLDHLSIIVSEYASEGGERERIDTIMTKLAKFCKETGVTIVLVVHLRKGEGSSRTFELGAIPSVDDLRGSASIKQLSWDVIALSRNQQHPDPICLNTTQLHVLKCRLTGRTGPADYLRFEERTGRMMNTGEPIGYKPAEKKGGW